MVQPWEEEAKLDEAVLEDCSKIDVTKALEDLRTFVNGNFEFVEIINEDHFSFRNTRIHDEVQHHAGQKGSGKGMVSGLLSSLGSRK